MSAIAGILDRVMRRFFVVGSLDIIWPDGARSAYRGRAGPHAAAALTNSAIMRRILLDPTLAIGEGYMDGVIVPQGCTIFAVLDLLTANLHANSASYPVLGLYARFNRLRRRIDQYNSRGRAVRNVAHHYDLDGQLYALFLDADRQYSCAYFATGAESLEQAQAAKKHHIARKLRLDRPGLRVLDIGCGWGGMAMTLARDYGCRVTGITLSEEQLAAARARAEQAGLASLVEFRLADYRTMDQKFDRIVSVGMFEHVGVNHFDEYFATLHRCLADDGVALLHSIGRSDGPRSTNRWMAKYIFPGGYSPALSEVLPALERSGLILCDAEILRLHYAQTLEHWRARFAANRADIAALYDERFCRMFEFYLASSELAFRRLNHMVFQLQLTRDQAAVPLTRGYLR